MWAFRDKGDRPVCLIPEVTGLIQEQWRENWSKTMKTRKVFYVSRCYRYERPQAGRYREFTQIGVEYLGCDARGDYVVYDALTTVLRKMRVQNWEYRDSIKRGLAYYVEDGFEVECPVLGAQKQIAGGGRYAEGTGWAIGLDRVMLTMR